MLCSKESSGEGRKEKLLEDAEDKKEAIIHLMFAKSCPQFLYCSHGSTVKQFAA